MSTRIPKGIPVLLAEPSEDGVNYRAWCPFCVAFHHHGYGGGHRGAHCTNPDSPLRETGYWLSLGVPADALRNENRWWPNFQKLRPYIVPEHIQQAAARVAAKWEKYREDLARERESKPASRLTPANEPHQ